MVIEVMEVSLQRQRLHTARSLEPCVQAALKQPDKIAPAMITERHSIDFHVRHAHAAR